MAKREKKRLNLVLNPIAWDKVQAVQSAYILDATKAINKMCAEYPIKPKENGKQ